MHATSSYNTRYNPRNMALDNEQLMKLAPSVFASAAHEGTSEKYTHIPTVNVVEGLRAEGWMPIIAGQSRTRDISRKGFVKHLIRFRNVEDLARPFAKDEKFPEIVLLNSHDGKSSYQLHAGIFRVACSNGMVVADSTIQKQTVRHQGDVVGNVIEGVYEIVKELPNVIDRIDYFKSLQLTTSEQHALARAAATLRWDGEEIPLTDSQIISPRRWDDKHNDLWTTFNRAQENIIRGGQRGITTNKATGERKHTTVREIKSVAENVRLNKALWALADEMAKLKA